MEQRGIDPSTGGVYFGQLLGMADNLTYGLGKAGYKAYKYVPYGPVHEVMPYLIRRAQVGLATHYILYLLYLLFRAGEALLSLPSSSFLTLWCALLSSHFLLLNISGKLGHAGRCGCGDEHVEGEPKEPHVPRQMTGPIERVSVKEKEPFDAVKTTVKDRKKDPNGDDRRWTGDRQWWRSMFTVRSEYGYCRFDGVCGAAGVFRRLHRGYRGRIGLLLNATQKR